MMRKIIYGVAMLPVLAMCLLIGGHFWAYGQDTWADHGKEVPTDPKDLPPAYYYPNIPANVKVLSPTSEDTHVLRQAKNRSEIITWADSETTGFYMPDIHTVGRRSCFAIIAEVGCGKYIPRVFFYAERPSNSNDKTPWKLIYVGPIPDHIDYKPDINTVYLDRAAKSMVFALHTGQITGHIDLSKVMDVLYGETKDAIDSSY